MSATWSQDIPDDGIPSYFGRLTQMRLLSAEEERELTKAIQKGDRRARERLIESNMRLVINIAKSYRSKYMPLEDLVQEGAVGLMQAAERFDPDRGFRFSTYATHWIRQAIGRAIDNKSKAIRLPAHVTHTLRKLERERERLTKEMGKEPTQEQLALAIGIAPNKLMQLVLCSQELLSLDLPVGEHGSTTLASLLRDPASQEQDPPVITEEILEELSRIISELNERESHIMRLRFRLEEGDSSPEAMAKELKLSRERLRQIEIQAMRKLRVIAQRRRMAKADEVNDMSLD